MNFIFVKRLLCLFFLSCWDFLVDRFEKIGVNRFVISLQKSLKAQRKAESKQCAWLTDPKRSTIEKFPRTSPITTQALNIICFNLMVCFFCLQSWRNLCMQYFLNLAIFWILLQWRHWKWEDRHLLCLQTLPVLQMLSDQCKDSHFMINLWYVILN